MLRIASFIFFSLLSLSAAAFDSFVIKDIRIEGLQGISKGTVFNYLPLKVGETLSEKSAVNAIKELFKTGFFHDIELGRDGDVLVLVIRERPTIDSIEISGNEEIETEQLTDGLKAVGLSEGRVFDRSLLDKMEQELQRQYFSNGKYGVKIDSTISELERNRVALTIEIVEGEAARIVQINLVGRTAFAESKLRDQFQLSTPTSFSGLSGSDKYSKPKLYADLESLRSYYMNRGYINFNIESTQVTITPDKKDIYVSINLNEGQQFTISGIEFSGDLIVDEEELRQLIKISASDIFSREAVTASSSAISDRLGNEGYAFANVNAIPSINEETQEVLLKFFVDPGKRAYVRRIQISGNAKTKDEVIRREMRQMEGGWMSTAKINRSRVRVQRLGFFEEVTVETKPVPGTADQMDVNYNVSEAPSGSLMASLGYGQTTGTIFNFDVTQNNFLGTGDRMSMKFSNSASSEVYTVSHTDPYYTDNGVSRTLDVYLQNTYAANANISNYTTNTTGTSIRHGIPINEFDRGSFGIGYEDTTIKTGVTVPSIISDWIGINGSTFDTIKLKASWSHDTRDRVIFSENGVYQTLNTQMALPGGALQFYKIDFRHRWYTPITKKWGFYLSGQFAFGDGYGETEQLPFFENYYAGGAYSVRGYRDNTVGPIDSQTLRPTGGNKKFIGNMEVAIVDPFDEGSRNFRVSTFIDSGNVWSEKENAKIEDLRVSYGLSADWLTPVGVLKFSFAWPVEAQPDDALQRFQFSIGAPF